MSEKKLLPQFHFKNDIVTKRGVNVRGEAELENFYKPTHPIQILSKSYPIPIQIPMQFLYI